jgi:hypothetical protein
MAESHYFELIQQISKIISIENDKKQSESFKH